MHPALKLAACGAGDRGMAKLRMYISDAVPACVAVAGVITALSGAHADECRRKTAGFYLEDTNAAVPHNLSSVLQDLAGSLTGAPGNAERGREVLVSRQK